MTPIDRFQALLDASQAVLTQFKGVYGTSLDRLRKTIDEINYEEPYTGYEYSTDGTNWLKPNIASVYPDYFQYVRYLRDDKVTYTKKDTKPEILLTAEDVGRRVRWVNRDYSLISIYLP